MESYRISWLGHPPEGQFRVIRYEQIQAEVVYQEDFESFDEARARCDEQVVTQPDEWSAGNPMYVAGVMNHKGYVVYKPNTVTHPKK